jgi:ABC-type glycerol-3-phosphate transport system permease component
MRRAGSALVRHLLLVLLAAYVMTPLLLMVATSFKRRNELFRIPQPILPQHFTFDSYVLLWENYHFGVYFLNSIIVGVVSTLLATLAAVLAGFGMSRLYTPGRRGILAGILLSQMVPATVIVVPFFQFLAAVGLSNTRVGLIAAHASFALPFATWMAMGFFRGIPYEIDEAAIVDGCTPLQRLFLILLPILRPGLVAVFIYTFLLSWKEYFFALILATSEKMYTVPVGIGAMVGEYGVAWNDVMAASVLGAIPAVIVYILLERHMVAGLAAGAVKG